MARWLVVGFGGKLLLSGWHLNPATRSCPQTRLESCLQWFHFTDDVAVKWLMTHGSTIHAVTTAQNCFISPSVLWHCWLAGRKGIRPVKILSFEVLAWLSVWNEVQMICIWSSCHPIISRSSTIQNGWPFWRWLTQVVLEKRSLNGCTSSSSLVKSYS